MTSPTPDQLRSRADRLEASARSDPRTDAQALVFNAIRAADALRAAANQLDAVRNLLQQCSDWEPGRRRLEWSINDHYFVDTEFWRRLTGILDPDTEQDADDD